MAELRDCDSCDMRWVPKAAHKQVCMDLLRSVGISCSTSAESFLSSPSTALLVDACALAWLFSHCRDHECQLSRANKTAQLHCI